MATSANGPIINWLPWKSTLSDRKTNFRLIIPTHIWQRLVQYTVGYLEGYAGFCCIVAKVTILNIVNSELLDQIFMPFNLLKLRNCDLQYVLECHYNE